TGGVARPGRRATGLLLAAAVTALGAAVALSHRSGPRPEGAAPPYVYEVQAEAVASTDAATLAALLPGARLESVLLRAEGAERPLASGVEAVAETGERVLLGWTPATDPPPVLRREVRPEVELRLVEAMREHLPAGSTVLAMPETSRRLAHFVPAAWPLATTERPLLLPGPLGDRRNEAAAIESARFGGGADEAAGDFEGFLDALLVEDVHGAARLRVLAGTGDAYVLVHLHDAFELGMIREGSLPMARRDFNSGAFSHDLAREAKAEVVQSGYAGYAIDRSPNGRLRGHFLIEARDTASLIGQLLPFNTSRLGEVPGLTLVFQTGGYWLYRIAPVEVAG
ncbi:hypothetical protein, partial [uncultured Amaricoccus sp.]|uniref:hypothetical protein n=1 Tax=uncultured Amaricoccus sp. TaxID=339341 RepID=UPI00260232C7